MKKRIPYKPTAKTLRGTPKVAKGDHALKCSASTGSITILFENDWTICVHNGHGHFGRWYAMRPAQRYPETAIEKGQPNPSAAVRKALQYLALSACFPEQQNPRRRFYVDSQDDVVLELPS